jgi:tRNA(Ile)-lysidine synthetase-like protein
MTAYAEGRALRWLVLGHFGGCHNAPVDPMSLTTRVEHFIRQHELIPPGGEVVCLVSGGADSTCLWHVLGALGYRVSALHVNHRLRGEESEEDARFCRDVLGAEVVVGKTTLQAPTEAVLREERYLLTAGRGLRATGHTASDQVETILYRAVSSGRAGGIKAKREDGVVRPLLSLRREETEAYCRAEGLEFRRDSSNDDTVRGLIRNEILPLLRRLHPAAEENLLALAAEPPRLPRGVEETLRSLLSDRAGTKQADLGRGIRAVREYGSVSLARGPVRWGPWTIESDEPGLEVRAWRPGDRLAGRKKKIQDVFVDAKVPRSQRANFPLVVRGDDVVAIPGIVDTPGVKAVRETDAPG